MLYVPLQTVLGPKLCLVPHGRASRRRRQRACSMAWLQAVDATIVSPITRAGEAQPRADVQPGKALDASARRKRRQTYPELVRARRCRLVVVRLSLSLSPFRVSVKPREAISLFDTSLRPYTVLYGHGERWSGLLAIAVQRTFAATLLELPLAGEWNLAWDAPELHEVLPDVRRQLSIPASRQGPH